MEPNAYEEAVARALAAEMFSVVPEVLETFCPVISRVAQDVFRQFGIPANLVPCQLWHSAPSGFHVLGFVGHAAPGKWDGHVVCMTESMLFDGALRGLQRDFNLQVPPVALVTRLAMPSHVIAGGIEGDRRLWWMNAPYGFDTSPPLESVDQIGEYADALVARLRLQLDDPDLRKTA